MRPALATPKSIPSSVLLGVGSIVAASLAFASTTLSLPLGIADRLETLILLVVTGLASGSVAVVAGARRQEQFDCLLGAGGILLSAAASYWSWHELMHW